MSLWSPHVNLVFAWAWILAGFVSGMLLGFGFHKPEFLGGYGSHQRRMYRLGHISFFGLGVVNILFYFTLRSVPGVGGLAQYAGSAFIVGGITMPICCAAIAHSTKAHLTFGIPVISLISGAVLTLIELL